MRLIIVTDAWAPQINGVVTTLKTTAATLTTMGHQVKMIVPSDFKTIACPTYPEIRLSLWCRKKVAAIIEGFNPDAIHIATEGPLGWAARNYCVKNGIKFTTSYHTQFPEYIRLRAPVPTRLSYRVLRKFHNPAVRTMVPTESQRQRLIENGFENVVVWGRGVNTDLFRPGLKPALELAKPVTVYVGRVAVEKNIEAFLELDLPGTKLVIGDGPDLETVRKKFPDAHYAGYQTGEELVRHILSGNLFVFPSKTDTFGLVMLEAMACGLPVAAYPVTGPKDVIIQGETGWLDESLAVAVKRALELDPAAALVYAREHSWETACRTFEQYLAIQDDRPGSDRPVSIDANNGTDGLAKEIL